MTEREAFEQLVSEWLDQRGREDLRAQVESAVAQSPGLARVKDEWLHLDRLVRNACPSIPGVDWPRLRQRIIERLDSERADFGVDQRVREATLIEQRVDWPRLRKRISQAVASADRKPTVIRLPLRRLAAGIALLAAAAVVVFMFTLPMKSPTAPTGFVRAHISAPVDVSKPHDDGRAFARVTVIAPRESDEAPGVAQPAQPGAGPPQLAEVFLMIEPVRGTAEPRRGLIPFDFN
jgi:hypothetical protein